MRTIYAFLLLTLLCTPSLARPFDYNFYLGPEYWLTSSTKANISSQLLTAGFAFRGNILRLLNAEFRVGVGEISNTKMYFNELSLLYTPLNAPNNFLGFGASLLNYRNILVKTNNTIVKEQDSAFKFQWEYSFTPLLGFYLKALGHRMWGYEIGWLAYFDKNFGDFNLSLGYKNIQLNNESAIKGAFISSNIYF